MQSSSVKAFILDHRELTISGWEFIRGLLKGYCDRPESICSAEGLQNSIINDNHQLWIMVGPDDSWEGAMVTVMADYENGKSALCVTAMSSARESDITWDSFKDIAYILESFAAEHGLDAVRIEGRKGWSRLLPGYAEVSRTIMKKIDRRA